MDTSQNEETREANDISINLEDLFNETFIQLDTTTEVREEEVVGEDDQNKTSHVEEEEQSNMGDSEDPNSEGNIPHTDLFTNIRIRTTKTN